jgi:hypothetical protein
MNGLKTNTGGRLEIRYVSRKSACNTCRLREQCLSQKSNRRTIYRWQHEAVIERHRARMKDAGGVMRQRACLVEHPFGTLKCRAGYRHFLVPGFAKVRGEWSLMALCYRKNHTGLLVLAVPLLLTGCLVLVGKDGTTIEFGEPVSANSQPSS